MLGLLASLADGAGRTGWREGASRSQGSLMVGGGAAAARRGGLAGLPVFSNIAFIFSSLAVFNACCPALSVGAARSGGGGCTFVTSFGRSKLLDSAHTRQMRPFPCSPSMNLLPAAE